MQCRGGCTVQINMAAKHKRMSPLTCKLVKKNASGEKVTVRAERASGKEPTHNNERRTNMQWQGLTLSKTFEVNNFYLYGAESAEFLKSDVFMYAAAVEDQPWQKRDWVGALFSRSLFAQSEPTCGGVQLRKD
jgi:hypothetical protein